MMEQQERMESLRLAFSNMIPSRFSPTTPLLAPPTAPASPPSRQQEPKQKKKWWPFSTLSAAASAAASFARGNRPRRTKPALPPASQAAPATQAVPQASGSSGDGGGGSGGGGPPVSFAASEGSGVPGNNGRGAWAMKKMKLLKGKLANLLLHGAAQAVEAEGKRRDPASQENQPFMNRDPESKANQPITNRINNDGYGGPSWSLTQRHDHVTHPKTTQAAAEEDKDAAQLIGNDHSVSSSPPLSVRSIARRGVAGGTAGEDTTTSRYVDHTSSSSSSMMEAVTEPGRSVSAAQWSSIHTHGPSALSAQVPPGGGQKANASDPPGGRIAAAAAAFATAGAAGGGGGRRGGGGRGGRGTGTTTTSEEPTPNGGGGSGSTQGSSDVPLAAALGEEAAGNGVLAEGETLRAAGDKVEEWRRSRNQETQSAASFTEQLQHQQDGVEEQHQFLTEIIFHHDSDTTPTSTEGITVAPSSHEQPDEKSGTTMASHKNEAPANNAVGGRGGDEYH
ncbi:unnamed protein product [Amoebophrya sp. A120]|nr:unnamed protein product [Amoebophrya sp. A120]|eukprot:GSA120T00009302001.1